MKEISEVLKGIELSDDQVKALDSFFEQYTQQIKVKVEADLREAITEEVKGQLDFSKEDAEKAFELFEADCEKAFELYEADCEKAFELYEEDCEKAAGLMLEDAQKEYTENMTKALQELYEEIEVRVKSDILESQEMKALTKIKEAISPIMLNEEQKKMLDEIEDLRKEKESINEEKAALSREKIIDTLMKDFPVQFEEQVRGFIEKAATEDEIYERFNTIVEMIDIDASVLKKTKIEEECALEAGKKKKEIKKEKEKEKKPMTEEAEGIFEVGKKDDKKIEKEIVSFSDDEQDLINLVFAQTAPIAR